MATEPKHGHHLRIGFLSPLLPRPYQSHLIAGAVAVADAAGARVILVQSPELDFAGPKARAPGDVQGVDAEGDHLGGSPSGSPLDRQFGGPPSAGPLARQFGGAPSGLPRARQFDVHASWDQVAGFLVVLNPVDLEYLQALRDAGKPVVMLSNHVDGFPCPEVRPDNRGGVIRAVSHLIRHGHRRIAFVGCLDQEDIRQRLDAYRDALTANGIDPDDSLVYKIADNTESAGQVAGRRMLVAGLPSTAVVAGTDYNALGIMRALQDAGKVLPRDQAVVGFDDIEAASAVQPTLSTVHQSFGEVARLGAELLLEMIRGGNVRVGTHLAPTVFVARESCGCTGASVVSEMSESDAASPLSPGERLRQRLAQLLVVGERPTARQADALDSAVAIIVSFAELTHPATESPRDGTRALAMALYSVSPRWSTITAAVACLRQYQRELDALPNDTLDTVLFELGITQVVIDLSRCMAQWEATTRAALHETMSENHELSAALLSGKVGAPTSLDWLAHTPARAGCLGVWSTEKVGGSSGRRLEITGAYAGAGRKLHMPAHLRIEEFPPESLLEDLDWGPGEIAVVFPTRTPSLDLGFLAVVTPIEPAQLTGRDILIENNALLGLSIERTVMMERLQRSNADLATFSHAMAHDLRNPLATIAMWASVARVRAGPGEEAAPMLHVVDQIKEVAEYADGLVSDLLHYAELDRKATSPEPVDLNLAAARVITTIGSSIAQQGAHIETGKLPTVPGRPVELELVLQNLIENAIKYRGERPPRIRLDAARDGGVWKVRCRDNGQGIPTDAREGVFEPFTRGRTSVPGSGLGLATCRRIVDGHGGHIWIAASGSLGTTVAFTLPAGPEAESSDGVAPEPAVATGRTAHRGRSGDQRQSHHAA